MPVVLQAIIPKRHFLPDSNVVKRRLKSGMDAYTTLVKEKMQVYPPPVKEPSRKKRTAGEQQRLEQLAAREGRELPSQQSRWRRYKRTKRLQRGWKSTVLPDGSQGFVFNTEKYAVYVQGPRAGGGKVSGQKQRRLHRGHGWQSITDVARETRKEFQTIMNRSITGSPRSGIR